MKIKGGRCPLSPENAAMRWRRRNTLPNSHYLQSDVNIMHFQEFPLPAGDRCVKRKPVQTSGISPRQI